MYSSRRLWWWSRGASNTFAGVQYRAYWVVWLGAILLALLGADLLALRLHRSGSYRLDLGFWGDQEVLTGFWEQEWDGTGASYRWTQARSALVVRGFAAVSRASLTLDIGGLPPTAPGSRVVSTEVDGVGWTTLRVMAAPRRYHLLLPPHALLDGNLDIQFRSDTSRVPPDPRAVGFRLDDLTLAWLPGSSVSPAWQTLLIQWAVVLVGMAVAWRLEAPRPVIAGLAAGLVILLSSMTAYSLFMATTWEKRLLVAGLLLMMLAWNAVPLLGRLLPGLARNELRWLAVIVVAALAVRFLGVCYPPFGSHDIHIHRGRLHHIRFGSLYLFDTPTEFGNGLTLVPPAFYLLALPFTVGSADPKGILEGLYALFDGSSPLLIALFVRQFGGSPRAVLLAAIALAGLPIQFTAVWWGFGPQIAGQWLLLLLALLVGQESVRARAGLVAAGMLFCLALLTHPGVALLGGFWLAGYVVLTWWFQREDRQLWWNWGVIVAVGAAVAFLLLYGDSFWLYLNGIAHYEEAAVLEGHTTSWRLIELAKGLRASVRPLGVSLALLSLIVLVRHTRLTHRWLVVAWLLSAGVFLAIDVLLGLQVRYGYFATPMVCAGLALLLDRLMDRRWGSIAGWGITGLITFTGLILWLNGVLWAVKPAMAALTH